jgi:hypothetical protein
MQLDVPAVVEPLLVPASHAALVANEPVIGVVAFGEARAYVKRSLAGRPERHVVNDRVGLNSIAVTHCNRTDCTRVLALSSEAGLLDVRCGGWLAEQEMALLVGDKTYRHSSPDIPLQDVPFVVTTWEKWKSAYPESQVYVGSAPMVRG